MCTLRFSCNRRFSAEKETTRGALSIAFSVRYGGVLCGGCENRDGAAFTIAPGSCELLKLLRKSEWERFNRIHASTRNHKELKRLLGNFIEHHTERNLKSLRFIENGFVDTQAIYSLGLSPQDSYTESGNIQNIL